MVIPTSVGIISDTHLPLSKFTGNVEIGKWGSACKSALPQKRGFSLGNLPQIG